MLRSLEKTEEEWCSAEVTDRFHFFKSNFFFDVKTESMSGESLLFTVLCSYYSAYCLIFACHSFHHDLLPDLFDSHVEA